MARTIVRPVEPQRSRSTRDGLTLFIIGVVLVFALLGVVSAGIFISDRVSASGPAKPTAVPGTRRGNSQAATELARAQAQATAIVKAAQNNSHSIVSNATKKANRQAAQIVAAAQKTARSTTAAAGGTGSTTTSPSSGTGTGTTGTQTGTGTGTSPVPNLGSLPKSWLVVAYNATFGSGPGTAGSVSVYNRSAHTFTGVVTVRYSAGGTAHASFSNLAPGQSTLLALNGPAYPGGGATVVMSSIHRIGL